MTLDMTEWTVGFFLGDGYLTLTTTQVNTLSAGVGICQTVGNMQPPSVDDPNRPWYGWRLYSKRASVKDGVSRQELWNVITRKKKLVLAFLPYVAPYFGRLSPKGQANWEILAKEGWLPLPSKDPGRAITPSRLVGFRETEGSFVTSLIRKSVKANLRAPRYDVLERYATVSQGRVEDPGQGQFTLYRLAAALTRWGVRKGYLHPLFAERRQVVGLIRKQAHKNRKWNEPGSYTYIWGLRFGELPLLFAFLTENPPFLEKKRSSWRQRMAAFRKRGFRERERNGKPYAQEPWWDKGPEPATLEHDWDWDHEDTDWITYGKSLAKQAPVEPGWEQAYMRVPEWEWDGKSVPLRKGAFHPDRYPSWK